MYYMILPDIITGCEDQDLRSSSVIRMIVRLAFTKANTLSCDEPPYTVHTTAYLTNFHDNIYVT